jgi:Omp85 superfamily domain
MNRLWWCVRTLILLSTLCFSKLSWGTDPAYITFPSDVDWVTRSSAHFDVLYRRGEDAFAVRALKAGEKAWKLLAPIFPPGPDRTWMVLADFSDSTNGYALTFPYPHIVIFAAPPNANEPLESLDDWLATVILHEYTHILHMYPASGLWSVARAVLGSWIIPNGLMPTHFHEGMATFMETQMTDGGRGRSAYFKMLRRMAVNAGVWGTDDFQSLDRMEGTTGVWPEGTTQYFFGYTLTSELWARKGAQGIHDLTLGYSYSLPYFLNGPLEDVYGRDYPKLWEEIFKKTGDETRHEIEAIRQHPLNHLKRLTRSKFNKSDVAVSPELRRVAFRRWTPKYGAELQILDLKTGRQLDRFETRGFGPEGMCWGKVQGEDELVMLEGGAAFGYSLNAMKTIHLPSTNKSNVVGSPRHLLRLSCNRQLDKFLVYQESAGKGSVREFSGLWKDHELSLKQLREWNIPDGSWVTSLLVGDPHVIGLRKGLSTSFYRWGATPTPILQMETLGHAYGFREGRHSNELLAIANFDDRDEVWELNLAENTRRKRVALLGGTNSFDLSDGNLVVSAYDHGGYDIVETKALDLPSAHGQAQISPTRQIAEQPDPVISEREEYFPFGSLLPRMWVPTLLFVPNGAQFGAFIPGFDVSQRHTYTLIGGYDTRGLGFADLAYDYRFGGKFDIGSEVYFAPNYILATQTFLKQWGATIGPGATFDFLLPYVQLMGVFRRVESSDLGPANQSIGLQLNLSKNIAFKRRPLSISPIQGTMVSVSHTQYFQFMGSNDNYFSTIAEVAQYVEVPWWSEHVFYIDAKIGYTEGTSLYNSFFQGGGEVLLQEGRAFFLNRGFEPYTFLGTRLFNLSLEYRFPIALIEHGIGLLPMNLKNISGAIVADTTSLDLGTAMGYPVTLLRRFYTSVGFELKTDWTFFFYIPTQLRVGGYHGFGPFGENVYVTFGFDASI